MGGHGPFSRRESRSGPGTSTAVGARPARAENNAWNPAWAWACAGLALPSTAQPTRAWEHRAPPFSGPGLRWMSGVGGVPACPAKGRHPGHCSGLTPAHTASSRPGGHTKASASPPGPARPAGSVPAPRDHLCHHLHHPARLPRCGHSGEFYPRGSLPTLRPGPSECRWGRVKQRHLEGQGDRVLHYTFLSFLYFL